MTQQLTSNWEKCFSNLLFLFIVIFVILTPSGQQGNFYLSRPLIRCKGWYFQLSLHLTKNVPLILKKKSEKIVCYKN